VSNLADRLYRSRLLGVGEEPAFPNAQEAVKDGRLGRPARGDSASASSRTLAESLR
jgi:hypothetical protein